MRRSPPTKTPSRSSTPCWATASSCLSSICRRTNCSPSPIMRRMRSCSTPARSTIACARQDCRANVFHTAPSRSMLADGLAEYLMWKQWRRWFLVVGSHAEDKLLGEAYTRAAKKFGAKIVETRTFEDTGGGRRSDSGVVQVQRQMPVATQNAPGLRCAGRRRRERSVRRLSALSHLGPAACRGLGRADADELGRERMSSGARSSCRTASSERSSAA